MCISTRTLGFSEYGEGMLVMPLALCPWFNLIYDKSLAYSTCMINCLK